MVALLQLDVDIWISVQSLCSCSSSCTHTPYHTHTHSPSLPPSPLCLCVCVCMHVWRPEVNDGHNNDYLIFWLTQPEDNQPFLLGCMASEPQSAFWNCRWMPLCTYKGVNSGFPTCITNHLLRSSVKHLFYCTLFSKIDT